MKQVVDLEVCLEVDLEVVALHQEVRLLVVAAPQFVIGLAEDRNPKPDDQVEAPRRRDLVLLDERLMEEVHQSSAGLVYLGRLKRVGIGLKEALW